MKNMATIKFEILSGTLGIFNVDSSSVMFEQLNNYITQDQCIRIISRINQRIINLKHRLSASCLVSVVIIILSIMVFFVVQIHSPTFGGINGLKVFILLNVLIVACVVCCGHCSDEEKQKRFRKLQSDIQRISDEEFLTIYQIAYTKWTIENIGDRTSGKIYKLTAEFRLQQQRTESGTVPSSHYAIDLHSIRLNPLAQSSTASALVLDLEQATASSDNEQHSSYIMAPATPPPPSYHKVVGLFSQGQFSNCPNCSNENCVFNEKYCTQCGYSLLI